MFLLRSIKADLCPNMINFDGVDFSECRSEEVISFFWHSVYLWKLVCVPYVGARMLLKIEHEGSFAKLTFQPAYMYMYIVFTYTSTIIETA